MQSLQNPYTELPYIQGLSFAPYSLTGSISYPPFSAFIFAGVYSLYSLLGIPSRFLYYFLLKQPMVASDVAVGMVLASFALRSLGDEPAKWVLKVWMYLPYSIIVSSVWGALDPIALLLILGSVYYFQQGKLAFSGVMLGLAIYLKTLPVIGLPVLLMQPGRGLRERLQLSLPSLLIPLAGTLVPIVVLNWGFRGLYNNFSYQVVIPAYGDLSALSPLGLLSGPGWARAVTGVVWLPALILAYFYVRKNRMSLMEGLITAFLVFSISRPFLPEQWVIYPLAFLLVSRGKDVQNFVGLAISGLLALVANNTLLVRFSSPVLVAAFNWDVTINNQSMFAGVRTVTLFLLAGLFFAESIFTLTRRPSLLYRAIASSSLSPRLFPRLETPREYTRAQSWPRGNRAKLTPR